jgi:hypothetical protein
MSITAANCSSPADASLRGAGGPGARMDLARSAGLGPFFLSRKLSLQTPRLRAEFGKPFGAHEIAQRTRRTGLALVDRRFWHIRHLSREVSMSYETLCNPVPAADVPVNFYREPAVATWFNRAREGSAHARLV